MSTRPFAQSAFSIAAFAGSSALRSLTIHPVVVLHRYWQAEVDRRRRHRLAGDLHAMSNRALDDIGVSRPAIDWVAHRGR